jgi:cell division protein FtsI/penicillin-binding protein 2
VQPGTGQVLALAASQPFGVGPGQTSVNLPVGGASGFQAGSTFKVFVLAQAIAQGIPLDLELFAPQVYVGSDNGSPTRSRTPPTPSRASSRWSRRPG